MGGWVDYAVNRYILFFSIIGFLTCMGFFSGCSDPDGSSTKNTNTIIGFWFPCELASSLGETADNCMTLDDDGYQFTIDGEIYDIEEATQTSEPECGQSPCFNSGKRSIAINQNLIGTYTYDGDSLHIDLFALGHNSQTVLTKRCSETLIWDISEEYFRYMSYCLPFESPIIKRYNGGVTIN